jgi:hypothetical protein
MFLHLSSDKCGRYSSLPCFGSPKKCIDVLHDEIHCIAQFMNRDTYPTELILKPLVGHP